MLGALSTAGADEHHLYWGVIHEHSSLSRSRYETTPEDLFLHMVTEAGLDFGAVTDYDWALADGTWPEASLAINRFHCPAGATGCYDEVASWPGYEALATLGDRRFVALLGYEWNNNSPVPEEPDEPQYGHRNVYLLQGDDPEAPYLSSESCEASAGCIPLVHSGEGEAEDREDWARYFPVCTLWEQLHALSQEPALGGLRFFTVPHHVAMNVTGFDGEDLDGVRRPASTDWSFHPALCEGLAGLQDPDALEPLVELHSTWGNNERADMDLEEDPIDGLADADRVVREAALAGTAGVAHRLGFVGSGDSHYGYPGHDPHHSYLLLPDGLFRSYQFTCAPEADCEVRFGQTGLVGVRVPSLGEPEEDLTREAIFDGLQARHTVATSGERFALELDLLADGDTVAVQGDDLRGILDLAAIQEASLQLRAETGQHLISQLQLAALGADGQWILRDLAAATGESSWSGAEALVSAGQAAAWLPEGPLLVYARLEAAPVGAIEIPEDAAALVLSTTDGQEASLSAPAGRYTAADLAQALQEQLDLSELADRYQLDWDSEAPRRFAFLPAHGEQEDLLLETAAAPDLARALGFRDDADSECSHSEPCLAATEVNGEEIHEQAWASPIWVDRSSAPELVTPPGSRCDCAATTPRQLRVPLALLALLGLRRRRRARHFLTGR